MIIILCVLTIITILILIYGFKLVSKNKNEIARKVHYVIMTMISYVFIGIMILAWIIWITVLSKN